MTAIPPPSSLRSRALRAILWTGGSSVANQVIAFGSTLVITRLVSPSDFGRVALAVVILGLVGAVTDTGVTTALIQRHEVDEAHIGGAFAVQAGVTACASALVALCAGLISSLVSQPSLRPILVVLSGSMLVLGLGAVPRALLIRGLLMKRTAVIDVCASLVGAAVGISLAVEGRGAWALVISTLATSVVSTGGAFLATRWRPVALSFGGARDLASFARSYYGYSLTNFLVRNADNLLVGKFLGTYQLGLYSRAYSLLLLPSRQTTSVMGNTLQVGLARIADDKPRSKRVYLEACGHIAFLVMPVMTLIAVLTEPFVAVVMGHRWDPAIPTIRILAIVGIIEPVVATCGWLYFAQGRPDVVFRLSWQFGPLYLIAFALGVLGGSSSTVSLAYLAVNVVTIPVLLATSGRLIGVRLRDHASVMRRPLVASLVGGAAAWSTNAALDGAGNFPRLVIGGLVGGVCYLLAAWRLGVPQVRLVAQHVGRLRGAGT